MTQLSGVRAPNVPKRTVTRYRLQMAADCKIFKGADVMIITSGTGKGYFAPADDARVGRSVARALETVDNTGGLIGATYVFCEFFRERVVFPFVNDAGDPLGAAHREQTCYSVDDQTVSATVSTVSAGLLFEVDADGVAWVDKEMNFSAVEASDLSDVAPTDPSSSAASAGVATEASRRDHLHHIALATPSSEGLMSAAYAGAIHAPVADLTALAAIAAADRSAGMLCMVLSDIAGEVSLWRFHATSTAADASSNLVKAPAAGNGRWLRADRVVPLYLPVTFATADAAVMFTTPVGARLVPRCAWHDVTTTYDGGSSSAIGASCSVTGWSTKGDILGGAGGDVAATLVSTNTRMVGTVGTKLDDRTDGRLILIADDTLLFDRITSVFTSGASKIRVLCDLLANAGA